MIRTSRRAEFIESSELKSVAVVDPPRAGLHPKAIFALRSSNIETLVYVSCDAKAAMNNFIDLGKMTSNSNTCLVSLLFR